MNNRDYLFTSESEISGRNSADIWTAMPIHALLWKPCVRQIWLSFPAK
jgi:hypothetical protein